MYFKLFLASSIFAVPCVASVLDSTRFIFAFGDSYTAEGWFGQGDPLKFQTPLICSSAGPNWARQFQRLAQDAKLINLAVPGATSDRSIVAGLAKADFRSQVTSFMTHVAPFPDKVAWTSENSIFTVSFGTNDVNSSYKKTVGNGTELYSEDLDSYFVTVERLYAAGARQFVFNNVVPFDRAQIGIRQGPELQAKLKESIVEFNSQLTAKAGAYCASKEGITCTVFDTYDLFTRIMDNFRSFGFATPDEICPSYALRAGCILNPIEDPRCLGPVSVYVWKDGIHPATAADTVWAEELVKQLTMKTDRVYNVHRAEGKQQFRGIIDVILKLFNTLL